MKVSREMCLQIKACGEGGREGGNQTEIQKFNTHNGEGAKLNLDRLTNFAGVVNGRPLELSQAKFLVAAYEHIFMSY